MIININIHRELLPKLYLLAKYSRLVHVSNYSLVTNRIEVIFPENYNIFNDQFSNIKFTIKVTDLIHILSHTNMLEIHEDFIIVNYEIDNISIYNKYKIHNETYKISCDNPLLSVKVNNFKFLCRDDINIQCISEGKMILETNNILETRMEFVNCTVLNECNKDINVKVKYDDIKFLCEFKEDFIFCFFHNFMLVYILEREISYVLLVPTY